MPPFGFQLTVAFPGLQPLTVEMSRLREDIADWRPFWREQFVPALYRQIRESFVLEGANSGPRWAALSPAYGAWKQRHAPGRGILVLSGALKASLSNAAAPGAIVRLTNTTAEVGSSVPHGIFHQVGTRRMKQRPPLRITPAFLAVIGHSMNKWVETMRVRRLSAVKRS